MKLWKVATASGPAYVQAGNEADAFAYAEAIYGKGNVTGTAPAVGSGDALPGSPILASAGQGSIQVVGKVGGSLFDLNRFAETMDGPTFASNIRQDANYSFNNRFAQPMGASIKVQPSPLQQSPGGDAPAGPILGSEDFGLLPAFEAGLRDRGMGYGTGSGVAGQLAGQEFGNLQSRGLLDAAFFAPPGQIDTSQFADADRPTESELNKFQGTTFQDYVKNAALFGGGATADANRLFSEALRLSQGRTPGFTRVVDPDDTERFLNRFDAPGVRGLPTPIAGAFLNPQQGAAGSEDLARAARQAGRSRFGFASKFLPSASNLTNSFFAQPQQGAQTFADFLNNRIFGV